MARTKGAKNRSEKDGKWVQFQASIYRLNVSYLTGHGTFQILGKDTKRPMDVSPSLDALKAQVLQQLLCNQKLRGLRHYSVAWQTHQSTGQPHLDVLLIYDKIIKKCYSSFNYLLELCPQRSSQTTPGVFITPYTKTRFNKAILDYGFKEDPSVLSNLEFKTLPSGETVSQYLQVNKLQKDPYLYLYRKMKEDPLHFNVQQYVQKNQLSQYIKGWSTIKSKLKDMQTAAANLKLKSKPGFKFISRQFIESQLNKDELAVFYSWKGYQKIVDYLNQMILQKGRRDPKTLNLLITGAPNTGKSALIWHPNPHDHFNPISKYCSVYPIGMSQWFPKYSSDVYHCIYWNQAKLTSYSYDTVLKLLDGSPLDLNTKGSVSRKVDNPLIIMTSNLTLDQMITQKFGYNKDYVKMARANLAVRVQNVVVPKGHNLFLLQKLLVQA